ncbi:MAG: DUF2336 domain-containing protein [Rhodospirillales bacterium]|nr:DUF2336 domain-containing protein [Rhodospirillales bacterium]
MSEIDGKYLMDLARDKSADRRQLLAETISDLFNGKKRVLTDRERALMFDILRKMLHNAEMAVRRIVSEQLADVPDAPPDLVKMLANDEIEVAYFVLRDSPVLKEQDLIEVIRHRTLEHQLAIAVRESVPEKVSDELVEAGDESVITALLKNSGAKISLATMEYLVEESKRVDAFQEPMLRREDLEPEFAKRMYMWVSAALRKYIVENFDFDQTVLDNLLEKAAHDQAAGGDAPNTKTDALAAEVDNEGLGLTKMMIRALKDGEVFLFEAMFRRLTGLHTTLIKRILFEPGGEGLAVACKASEISTGDFSTIFSLSRMSRPAVDPIDHEGIQRVLEFYDRLSPAAARDVVNRWRRDIDYQKAIREVELDN